jgi:hypothetical protein
MKCQDVRRALSFLVHGELPLTEWAIIQSHLRDCAECGREFDRVRIQAGERVRARRRQIAVAALGATAVLLVMVVGGVYVYQRGSFPDLPRPDAFRLPPWGPAPAPPRTVAPTPLPQPPAPSAPAAVAPAPPPAVRSRPVVEPVPRATAPPVVPASEPAPRAPRPAATVGASTAERMPTQARPPAVLTAPPNAEAMPTQTPARPGPRSR